MHFWDLNTSIVQTLDSNKLRWNHKETIEEFYHGDALVFTVQGLALMRSLWAGGRWPLGLAEYRGISNCQHHFAVCLMYLSYIRNRGP